jgi:RsiW-degrading membrane proteinase PrsW (M82 family)
MITLFIILYVLPTIFNLFVLHNFVFKEKDHEYVIGEYLVGLTFCFMPVVNIVLSLVRLSEVIGLEKYFPERYKDKIFNFLEKPINKD